MSQPVYVVTLLPLDKLSSNDKANTSTVAPPSPPIIIKGVIPPKSPKPKNGWVSPRIYDD